MQSMRIVIPGGSGQVGTVLARAFHGEGHDVVVLSRRPARRPWRVVVWDGVTAGAWSSEIDGADVVINLAGRSVNCRYNATNRREIIESRVLSTRAVGTAIARSAASAPRLAAGQHCDDLWASLRRAERRTFRRDWWRRAGRPGYLAFQHRCRTRV